MEWQFADIEHIFMKHATERGVAYDSERPLAGLEKGAIGKACRLLGISTRDVARAAQLSESTPRGWDSRLKSIKRESVTQVIFPALCDVVARPYKARPAAYENSAWIIDYIEESVASALTSGTVTPEDAASDLDAAWNRYNVATLMLAAFSLPPDKLETVAGVARLALVAPLIGASVRTQRPESNGDPARDTDEAMSLVRDAEALERAAVWYVPERSVVSIDFDRLKELVEDRSASSTQ